MLVSFPCSSSYPEATLWNKTNFFLPEKELICQIFQTLPVVDVKAFACTCKKVHEVVILARLNKYLTFEDARLFEDVKVFLFDNTIKNEVNNLSDNYDKYIKIFHFLLKKNFKIYVFPKTTTEEKIVIPQNLHSLLRWVSDNERVICGKVFEFLLDFGLPVKNLAINSDIILQENKGCESSLFEELIQKPERAIKLIEAGTRIEDCQKIIEKFKEQIEFEKILVPSEELKIIWENIAKVESFLETFHKRGQPGF